MPRDDNPLKHAPHTAEAIAAGEWTHPYPREQAAFPARLDARAQVLALRRPHQQRPGRPAPRVHVPAD